MKKARYCYFALILALIQFSVPSWAQTNPESKFYGGLLWKAERDQWTVYLYGVSHEADTLLELNARVRKLIESSDLYISEIPLGKHVEYPAELISIRRTFIDNPIALNREAEMAFRKLHLDGLIGAYQYWVLRHQSPITAARGLYGDLLYKQFVSTKAFATDFPKSQLGPDRIALNFANSKRINTLQIEPANIAVQYWLKNCDSERDNSSYLLSTIDILVHHQARFKKMYSSVLESNLPKLQQAADEDIEYDFFRLEYQCHMVDRNKLWAQSLNRLASTRETSLRSERTSAFFTFGAMHAISPKTFPGTSLVDLLRQQGWQIQWMGVNP